MLCSYRQCGLALRPRADRAKHGHDGRQTELGFLVAVTIKPGRSDAQGWWPACTIQLDHPSSSIIQPNPMIPSSPGDQASSLARFSSRGTSSSSTRTRDPHVPIKKASTSSVIIIIWTGSVRHRWRVVYRWIATRSGKLCIKTSLMCKSYHNANSKSLSSSVFIGVYESRW